MSTNETPQTEAPTTNHQRDTEAVAKRVHRALDSFFHVEATGDDGEYTVFSGSSSTYTVDLSDGTCTCPDGQRGPWCKHAYRAAFVTGEIPDIDGVHVAVSEDDSSDDDRDVDGENDDIDGVHVAVSEDDSSDDDRDVDGENDDSETLAERVERFEQANPDASAIVVISQLGIDPNQKERVEEVLAE